MKKVQTKKDKKEKVVMVFGVFDALHEVHVSFLKQASQHGERLVAVVARDESVMRLKKHNPRFFLTERIQKLSESEFVHEAIPGDNKEGGWEVILKHCPDIVALGYDQCALHESLAKALPNFPFSCKIVVLEAYKPDQFHSSLLYQKQVLPTQIGE